MGHSWAARQSVGPAEKAAARNGSGEAEKVEIAVRPKIWRASKFTSLMGQVIGEMREWSTNAIPSRILRGQRGACPCQHQGRLGGFAPFLKKVSMVNLPVVFSLLIVMRCQ